MAGIVTTDNFVGIGGVDTMAMQKELVDALEKGTIAETPLEAVRNSLIQFRESIPHRPRQTYKPVQANHTQSKVSKAKRKQQKQSKRANRGK
jgi:hypothetical protein